MPGRSASCNNKTLAPRTGRNLFFPQDVSVNRFQFRGVQDLSWTIKLGDYRSFMPLLLPTQSCPQDELLARQLKKN